MTAPSAATIEKYGPKSLDVDGGAWVGPAIARADDARDVGAAEASQPSQGRTSPATPEKTPAARL